ncbi:MAG: tRNA (adenosine(37)-N6)-threonylcarbamoyltransferase complex dimerization subunit type 1 TsaB [Fusobacteriaceae bacterium]|jgi:N6-L-threonylcarbamoyladenine synthase|nr:tRNA (adenosine(37)-N6)-threonylcarbamoyltransferase complex dimerization subunit type 1 TsaB [Fusobacteriaceae bacterium]
MLVLAVDTAAVYGGCALYDDAKGLAGEITVKPALNHSAVATKLIADLLDLSGRTLKEIDRVAVVTGPGSFTGIRVGLSLAKGLAFSLGKEIVGVNALLLSAYAVAFYEHEIIPMIDAGKGRVYCARYRKGTKGFPERLSDDQNAEISDYLQTLDPERSCCFVGDGALKNRDAIGARFQGKEFIAPESAFLARSAMAAKLAVTLPADNLFTLDACYAGKSQAERMKEQQNRNA